MKKVIENGGPVMVHLWHGQEDFDDVQKAVGDFTSRLMACWSLSLNLLLKARGVLEEGEQYELRSGHLSVMNGRVTQFIIEVVYERFEEDGKQIRSVPCVQIDMLSKIWTERFMSTGEACIPDSRSWEAAKEVFGEMIRTISWVEAHKQ